MKRGRRIPQAVADEVRERSRGICEMRMTEYSCTVTATEFHHKKSRARGGSNTARNIVHGCHNCHRAVTEHRPGTARFRTHSWQEEGKSEEDWRSESGGDHHGRG